MGLCCSKKDIYMNVKPVMTIIDMTITNATNTRSGADAKNMLRVKTIIPSSLVIKLVKNILKYQLPYVTHFPFTEKY